MDMSLSERIREVLDTTGLSQADLARATKTTNAAVTLWLNGQTKTLKAEKALFIEKATGFNSDWLVNATGQKRKPNIEARSFSGEVPVISWVQAGSWHEAADSFQPGEAERYLPIVRGHSKSTFALRVRGDSMTAPHGKSYPEGCYIVVDPEKQSPVNGDRVVAKLQGTDEVTFKVYKEEDGRRWLAPLNQMHQPMTKPFKIVGTVISKFEDE